MSKFQTFLIMSMTPLSFMLLRGFISKFKRANVRMIGADVGFCLLKCYKAFEGILKIPYD